MNRIGKDTVLFKIKLKWKSKHSSNCADEDDSPKYPDEFVTQTVIMEDHDMLQSTDTHMTKAYNERMSRARSHNQKKKPSEPEPLKDDDARSPQLED